MAVKMLNPGLYCSFVCPDETANSKYQKAAAVYKLKSSYPLYSEKTLTDYVVSNGKMILFASEADGIKGQRFVSSHLFLMKQNKSGLSFYVSDSWASAVKTEDDNCIFYEFLDEVDFQKELGSSFEKEKGSAVNVFYERKSSEVLRKNLSEHFDVHESYVSERLIKTSYRKCRIFCRRKLCALKKSSAFLILFMILSGTFCFKKMFFYKEEQLKNTKNNSLMKNEGKKTAVQKIKKNYTPFSIIAVLCRSGNLKDIRSFQVEKTDFKIDLLNFSEEKTVSELRNENCISSVSIDGIEWNEKGERKSRISGKLKNDAVPAERISDTAESFSEAVKGSSLVLKKMTACKGSRNESAFDFVMEGTEDAFIDFSNIVLHSEKHFYFESFTFSMKDKNRIQLSCRIYPVSAEISYAEYEIINSTLGLIPVKQRINRIEKTPVETAAVPAPIEKKEAEKYFFIGSFENHSDGNLIYYFKNSSGKIFSADQSQIVTEEDSELTVVLEGKKINIER